MQFKRHFLLIQCITLYQQYYFAMGIIGVRRLADPGEFPSVVSIMQLTNGTLIRALEIFHKCTGTLISKQDIITAQHCIASTFTHGFQIMIGSHDIQRCRIYLPLFIWTYEHWMLYRRRTIEYNDHDIAIVKLTANVPDNIQFATNGNIPSELLYGMNVETAGWGNDEDDEPPRYMETASMTIMSNEECAYRYRVLTGIRVRVDERRLCSMSDPHVVLSEGDSGGPIFFFGALVGINVGVCPNVEGSVQPHQINLHFSLRYYHEYFNDVLTRFRTVL